MTEQTEQDVYNRLIERGEDPKDFNVTISENGYTVTPKWYYESKQIAKKEDITLALEVSQREIENIELGQQISNLEIQMLEKGGV